MGMHNVEDIFKKSSGGVMPTDPLGLVHSTAVF